METKKQMKSVDVDGPIRLLLVEDDQDSATALQMILEKRGLAVSVLQTAEDAVAVFKPEYFDVVLTDIRLKKMSGVDLLRHIRMELPDFPVILYTGHDSLSTAIEAVRLSAQDYIIKPVNSVDDILGPVRRAVRSHRLAIANKIHEERERETQIRLAHAEKVESLAVLAGGVAHDLSNALQPIAQGAESLTYSINNNRMEDLRMYARDLKDAVRMMAEIVNDLLTMSRSGSLRMTLLNMNDIIEKHFRSIQISHLKAENGAIRFVRLLDRNLSLIQGSESQLQRVIMNLTMNACEAMPKGGSLTIMTSNEKLENDIAAGEMIKAGEYVVVRFQDTGAGISEEHRRRIFEPFFTTKEMGAKSGTGLGLAVVHGVVKEHGGYIDLRSEDGKGTEFALYFPVAKAVSATNHEQQLPI